MPRKASITIELGDEHFIRVDPDQYTLVRRHTIQDGKHAGEVTHVDLAFCPKLHQLYDSAVRHLAIEEAVETLAGLAEIAGRVEMALTRAASANAAEGLRDE